MSTTTEQTIIYSEGAHTVPLSHVWVRDGFNPRQQRNDRVHAMTAASIAASGVLQPILVTPETPEGAAEDDVRVLRVVAGEGRYLAAVQAEQETIPVVVRVVDPETGGLELAIEENVAREQMDPVSIAQGFRRLKDAGWSYRQIAQRLGISAKLVTERMRIVKLPEDLHPKITDGTIPLSAIKPLADMAGVHPDLPAVAIATIEALIDRYRWVPNTAWARFNENPVRFLTQNAPSLPDGIYPCGGYLHIPLETVDLTDEAQDAIAELSALRDEPVVSARLDTEALDQARAMRCLRQSAGGDVGLLIGRDVASQLVSDMLLRTVERERAAYTASHGDDVPPPATPEEREAAEQEERREEREAAKKRRREAIALNDQLGAEVARHLARVDPTDVRVIQLLAVVNVIGRLDDILSRGARYAFPGWVGVESRKSGDVPVFPGRDETMQKARVYLAAVKDPGEVAGRLLTLIALAHYADDHAIARSHRIYWEMPSGKTPWGTEPVDLLHSICGDLLPAAVTEHRHKERAEAIADAEQHEREKEEARARVDAAVENAANLTVEEREAVLEDVGLVYGYRYGGEGARICALIEAAAPADDDQAADAPSAEDDTTDHAESEEPAPAAAP